MKRNILLVIAACMMIAAFFSCGPKGGGGERAECRDLEQIKDSGELVVLTMYSSTSYFLYRGQEMGFQYELSRQFAKSIGVKLRLEIASGIPEMLNKLEKGEADLIAYPIPITKERKDSVTFCGVDYITHQVIVQRNSPKEKVLTDVTQLVGREVYAKPGKYLSRLKNLNEELGGGIIIKPVTNDSISAEDLIMQVAEKKIDYAVADNDVAQINRTYYPQLNVSLQISFDQKAKWAVAKGAVKLAEAIEEWSRNADTKVAYQASARRYFEQSKTNSFSSPIMSLREGIISRYDGIFRKYAKEIGWDWKLLASLAYQESNFNPNVVSWAGAKGLMQLMPRTARQMGVPKGMEHDPEQSVKGAVKCLKTMDRYFGNIPEKERVKFVLAAYNSGLGHVKDARALAGKYGKNNNKWDNNVEEFILLKSNPEYYNDPVCRCGYFRGIETYNFVRSIMARYDIYRDKIK